ncbi:MAG: hypothetical protein FWG10_13895 [Eubacteriaceae bacterium]|nr:hypothetical protein [Eubacteriaceae bacterium]
MLHISTNTVSAVKRKCSGGGAQAALNRKIRLTDSFVSKITGEFEERIIATAQAPAPPVSISPHRY